MEPACPHKTCNYTYIAFISALALVAFSPELSTWIRAHLKTKSSTATEKLSNGIEMPGMDKMKSRSLSANLNSNTLLCFQFLFS